ncbi:MAG: glutathione transferase GstA [Kofleriaceae bacterium]
MKLYYARGACSLSPHIVLREAERRFELERVELSTHRTSTGQDFWQINPKGYVPVLEIDRDELLTEGPAIVQYVADLVPEKRLAPPNGTFARYHLQEWLNFISTEIHKQFSPLFRSDTPAAYAEILRGRLGDRLIYLSDVLASRGFLMGETFTVADAYLFTMLQWGDRFGIDLAIYPNLDDYEFRISQRPAVRAALDAEGLPGRHQFAAA